MCGSSFCFRGRFKDAYEFFANSWEIFPKEKRINLFPLILYHQM